MVRSAVKPQHHVSVFWNLLWIRSDRRSSDTEVFGGVLSVSYLLCRCHNGLFLSSCYGAGRKLTDSTGSQASLLFLLPVAPQNRNNFLHEEPEAFNLKSTVKLGQDIKMHRYGINNFNILNVEYLFKYI